MNRTSLGLLIVVTCLAAPAVHSADSLKELPKDGYYVKKTESHSDAPVGWTGRTDTIDVKAISNAPETQDSGYTLHIVFGNQIKTCPQADGTVEGNGNLTAVLDRTIAVPDGVNHVQMESHTVARYKGQVGEDAWISPVTAKIDFTYSLKSGTKTKSGAQTNSPPINAEQHLTKTFSVSRKPMDLPEFGTTEGGDLTQGHFESALNAANALVFWAGVYYSIAQSIWTQGNRCVEISFDPPDKTVSFAPGASTVVHAELKTRDDKTSVKAKFMNARPFVNGGNVRPSEGQSDIGHPLGFTYTAPEKKVDHTGFLVGAVSHAGVASEGWELAQAPKLEIKWQMSVEQDIPQAFKISSSTRLGPIPVDLDDNGTWTSEPQKPVTTPHVTLAPKLASKCSLGAIENPPVQISIKREDGASVVTIKYLPRPNTTPGTAKLHCSIPGYPAAGAPFALTLMGSSFRVSAEDLAKTEWTDHDAAAKSATSLYGALYHVKSDKLSVRAVK